MRRTVRMGIDVGGTHTKAVAIDNETQMIIGKSSVKTTHDSDIGVARGVVEAFVNCLNENNISATDVVFVAHSTTQATNALIEGDVSTVGIIGMGRGFFEGLLAKIQTSLKDINIDKHSNKKIKILASYLNINKITEDRIEDTIIRLKQKGAEVIVSSCAFGVDGDYFEETVANICSKNNIHVTMASSITKLYGLTRRTRTAAINASILPKMLNTANSTEDAVKSSGVSVPLMIMRGDGGVMEINEMKKRPVLTMMSGPAASVMGSLMYLRASNGVYFEVGGTTTNIGVIKNGRPAIDYSSVGGYKTYISSLDVKVLGVAGGSMVRANKNGIIDVGPRSAHIAGLEYSVYTDSSKIKNPKLEFFSPKEEDPADYVRVKLEDGTYITITNSCAANALGIIKPEHFSYGNKESAIKAIKVLADYCGKTVDEIASEIMEKSFLKIKPVIINLAKKYKLEHDQITLVGVGGGAAALIIYLADKMNLNYSIPENAEVISSIGVALAMVRDVVERVVPSPTKEDIALIKTEATNKAIESGATPESIDVHIEIDSQTSKITAIATGSTEVKTSSMLKECTLEEAKAIAGKDLKSDPTRVALLSSTNYFYVFGLGVDINPQPIRIIDKKGFIKVQRKYAVCVKSNARDYLEVVRRLWESMALYKTELIERPEYYICVGAKVMDFSSMNLSQLELLMEMEISSFSPNEELLVIAANSR